jgi:nitrite reductase/ring-hydroxylating ferredoxin subunit/uncharacterized membrane protein
VSLLDIETEKAMEQLTPVADAGTKVSLVIHDVFLSSEGTRYIADFLHGTWLGHPLHPVLTDITIGAWAMAGIFDAAGAITDSDELRKVGDHLTTAGTISAIPTAITGLTDYSTFPEPSAAPATLHAMLNTINFGFYIASVRARRRGDHSRGVLYSTIGLGLTAVSAWLGGKLVYTYKVGVDHSDKFEKPERWTTVLDASSLPMRTPKRVEYDGKPVLIYREGAEVYAIGATCSHAGGPLNEGKFSRGCVECPWHQSVFNLENGHVVHGPATHPQPGFEARIESGKVQIRLCKDRECRKGNPEGNEYH